MIGTTITAEIAMLGGYTLIVTTPGRGERPPIWIDTARDVAALAVILGATVRTHDTALIDACRRAGVMLIIPSENRF